MDVVVTLAVTLAGRSRELNVAGKLPEPMVNEDGVEVPEVVIFPVEVRVKV